MWPAAMQTLHSKDKQEIVQCPSEHLAEYTCACTASIAWKWEQPGLGMRIEIVSLPGQMFSLGMI